MQKLMGLTAICATSATALFAGGLDRTGQSTAVLFEDGRYLEMNLGLGMPDVSGTIGPFSSGNMSENFLNLGFAYKADLNDTLSYAIIYDQPFGAKVEYPAGTYPFATSTASFKSHALTGILQYNMPNNVSMFGGLRAQTIEANARVLAPISSLDYTASSDADLALGYLVGVAYEKPEIAMRVALTYNSKIEHKLDTVETLVGAAADVASVTEIEMPQSVNLDVQSGVAEDTLVFGSIRWADWSEADIAPAVYSSPLAVGAPLVSFADDRTTFTLGVGRKLNETWSIAGSIGYEKTTGSVTGNLAPTDGFKSIGIAAIYTKDNVKITSGLRYVDIGRADTTAGAAFEDNSAIAAGIKVGWQF